MKEAVEYHVNITAAYHLTGMSNRTIIL